MWPAALEEAAGGGNYVESYYNERVAPKNHSIGMLDTLASFVILPTHGSWLRKWKSELSESEACCLCPSSVITWL